MKKLTTITVIGNIGSGKSTLVPILTKFLNSKKVEADNLFQTRDPFREKYLKDQSRWGLINELWLTLERAKILRELGNIKNKWVIIDSGLLMSWAYTYSHFLVKKITKDEWNLYENLFDLLTEGIFKSTVVVRLNYSVDSLIKRIKKRGRNYELRYYDKKYLKQIELGIEALVKKLRRKRIKLINLGEKKVNNLHLDCEGRKKMAELVLRRLND